MENGGAGADAVPPEPAVWNDWALDHEKRMQALLDTGHFADMIVLIGPETEKKEINVISQFLQAGSPVLQKMIEEAAPDPAKGKKVIRIEGAKFEDFKLLLKYLYVGNCEDITMERSLPLLKLAADFQVAGLAARCAQRAKEGLNLSNALAVFQAAMECRQQPELLEYSLRFICRHAWQVIGSQKKGFLSLTEEALIRILEQTELEVPSELFVFDAVYRWGQEQVKLKGDDSKDHEKVKSVLENLTNFIRYPLMSRDEFAQIVLERDCLTDKDNLHILLFRDLKDGFREEATHKLRFRFSVVPRKYCKPGKKKTKSAKEEELNLDSEDGHGDEGDMSGTNDYDTDGSNGSNGSFEVVKEDA